MNTTRKSTNTAWRRSSFSMAGECVELRRDDAVVHVRNSNHPDDGTLAFTAAVLGAFILGCRHGEFDDLAG